VIVCVLIILGTDWQALGTKEPTFKANIGNLVWIGWSDFLESKRRNPRIAVTLALRARVVNTSKSEIDGEVSRREEPLRARLIS